MRAPVAALMVVLTGGAAWAEEAPQTARVLVVAAQVDDLAPDHYLWAAELTAARFPGSEPIAGGLSAALKRSREHRDVAGIIEVMIDVYSYQEEVRITCYDSTGTERWKKKAKANMGGSEEKLAREMLQRALKKAEGQACP